MTNRHCPAKNAVTASVALRDPQGLISGSVRVPSKALETFVDDLEASLQQLEQRFQSFITHRSYRGSIGR